MKSEVDTSCMQDSLKDEVKADKSFFVMALRVITIVLTSGVGVF